MNQEHVWPLMHQRKTGKQENSRLNVRKFMHNRLILERNRDFKSNNYFGPNCEKCYHPLGSDDLALLSSAFIYDSL